MFALTVFIAAMTAVLLFAAYKLVNSVNHTEHD